MKLLIADDDAVSRKLLEGILKGWGHQVSVATNGNEAWQILQENDAPRLAILDWMMPGMDGVQLCQSIRARPKQHYTYILLVTAKARKDEIIRGLEAGADDYLSKPYDPQELKARLISGRRILDLQEELIAAREAMSLHANRDHLTGAWNRRMIMEILERELNRSQREGCPLSVILVDLDHFKAVNDTYGHLAGDEVLRESVKRMDAAIRPYDLMGRWGGEEFLIVVPNINGESAQKLAERLRSRIAAEPVTAQDHTISITASFGVVVYGGTGPVCSQTLLHDADLALYQAKEGGRNQVRTRDFLENVPR